MQSLKEITQKSSGQNYFMISKLQSELTSVPN